MSNGIGSKNMITSMDTDGWDSWFQRKQIAPDFSKHFIKGTPVLTITSTGKFEEYGKWITKISDISEEQTYKFSVEYLSENIEYDNVSIHSMLTWVNETGDPLARDYVDIAGSTEDGWRTLSKTIEAPIGAKVLKVELVFKWSERGKVTWKNPVFIRTEPIKHRKVKVSSVFADAPGDLDGNLKGILNVIDLAGSQNPDIICLGETAYDRYLGALTLEERCVTIPGPVTDKIAEKAKEYNAYIIISLNEKEGDYYYNTGLLIDRSGTIAGKYRKIQLPLCEGEEGISPGRDCPVFETDFGKIGIMICWDHGFPQIANTMRSKGAEILFLPTLWNTQIQAPARAVENGVYVVVSGPRWSYAPCKVISPEGEIISAVYGGEYNEQGVCSATIDLDKRFYTQWLSVGNALGEGRSIYLQERRPDSYR